MAKNSCIITPEVNGKPSHLYQELLKKTPSRAVANLLYATYLANPQIAIKMDAAVDANGKKKYVKNIQGQHTAKGLMDFLHYNQWQQDVADLNVTTKKQYGAIDQNGQAIDYKDAKEALEKANKINEDFKGVVATVIKHDSGTNAFYNILVRERTDATNMYKVDVNARLKIWDLYKQEFNKAGIDIDNAPDAIKDIFSPMTEDLPQYLINLQKFTTINNLFEKDALILFYLGKNTPRVQRLVNAFGSIEEAAKALSNFNMKTGTLTKSQATLLMNAVNQCKKMQNIDLANLKKQTENLRQQLVGNSPEEAVRLTLHKLNQKYHIGATEIHKTTDKIKSISDAAEEAVYNLERRIRELKMQEGNTAEEKRLARILNSLYSELEYKRYYSGIINFLGEAASQVSVINKILSNVQQGGTELDELFAKAKALYQVSQLKRQYYAVVSAIANKDTEVDENISQDDINNMRESAQKIKDIFDGSDKVCSDLTESVMQSLMLKLTADNPDGTAIINSVTMAAKDASFQDKFLYSMSRVSNPIVAVMGGIINKAKVGRNDVMNDFDTRITKATKALYKSGSNSEFMYEDDGHIISDIDWKAYYQARALAKQGFAQQGLKGFDFREALDKWEANNTEDRVVDKKNGRTERVPNGNYRKAFIKLTAAQQLYYDTVMQIKGEIGSLLPSYAQHQYLPPQLRRNMFDAIGHAKSIKDVAEALGTKAVSLFKVREDDTNFHENGGIIEGEEYQTTLSDYDGTPLKHIPIFFVNKVDQGELLKDFSGGLNALAGTAINYDAMASIEDVINFMGDFIKDQHVIDKDLKADVVGNGQVQMVKDLWSFCKKSTGTSAMVDAFINRALYGINRNPNENKTFRKFVNRMIQYTSFKGLTTNLKGAVANAIMGEFQMLIETGAGEFYGFKDYCKAHAALFGASGNFIGIKGLGGNMVGDIWDMLNETKNSKAYLLSEMFDPEQENYDTKTHKRYHKNILRKILSHDLTFIGYGSGEYLIHKVGMYGCLFHEKVKINGQVDSLYNAFEVVNKENGAAELKLKDGTTDMDGNPITIDSKLIDQVKRNVKYVNQSTHGAMNEEDKGLIYQSFLGAMAMNFRQWMVEHYSRRFRKLHYDAQLERYREGYWISLWRGLKENWKDNQELQGGFKGGAIACFKFMRDILDFAFTAKLHWATLDEVQKANLGRAQRELSVLVALLGLSLVLGEPEDNKGNKARRFWIYQVKRMILDTESSMPLPQMPQSILTIMQSPFASAQTFSSLLYIIYGLLAGDEFKTYQQGKNEGKNVYLHNVIKYDLPFYKDWEQWQEMAEKDDVFKVFKLTPSGY